MAAAGASAGMNTPGPSSLGGTGSSVPLRAAFWSQPALCRRLVAADGRGCGGLSGARVPARAHGVRVARGGDRIASGTDRARGFGSGPGTGLAASRRQGQPRGPWASDRGDRTVDGRDSRHRRDWTAVESPTGLRRLLIASDRHGAVDRAGRDRAAHTRGTAHRGSPRSVRRRQRSFGRRGSGIRHRPAVQRGPHGKPPTPGVA